MKKSTLVIFFLLASLHIIGQKVDTIFVDDYNNKTIKTKASYFVIKTDFKYGRNSNTWTQNTYYLTNEIAEACPIVLRFDTFPSSPKREGTCKEYYQNGNIKSIKTFRFGVQDGYYAEYYSNGKLKTKGRYENIFDLYVYNDIDSVGVDRLVNGNGSICRFDSIQNCVSYYEIKDSVMTVSYYIDDEFKDTIYNKIDTKIEPLKGWRYFQENLSKSNVPYRKMKKFRGSRLIIQFIVYENGKIGRVKNLNSLTKELDDLFLEEVKNVCTFNRPVLKNGKSVKVSFRIPLRMG